MSTSAHICIIDDDAELSGLLRKRLSDYGFAVSHFPHGEAFFAADDRALFDLIILDVMLPGEDGLSICRRLREVGSPWADVPILFLSALGESVDRVIGLEVGGDDYLAKPYAPEELLARIRSVLRRPAVMRLSEKLIFGDIQYEPHTLTLSREGNTTVLSKRLGDLLELFLRNPGQTLPRETILLRVWGMDSEVEDGNLDNYTYFLRRSLRKVGSKVQLATVRGVGYRLEEGHV